MKWHVYLLIVKFWLALGSLVMGEYSPVIQPDAKPYHRAVVRVHAGKYSGSGTLVAIDGKGTGTILTCHHVVSGASPYTVKFQGDDRDFTARLIASDPMLDIAALWCYVPDGIEPIPLASQRPAKGDTVELCGFGGRRWGVTRAEVLGYFAHRYTERTDLGISHISIPGESGGPILCFENGEPCLAAVNWGGSVNTKFADSPMKFSQGADCEQVKAWLKSAWKKKYRTIEVRQ